MDQHVRRAVAASMRDFNRHPELLAVTSSSSRPKVICPDCGARVARPRKSIEVGEVFLECPICGVGSPRSQWKKAPKKGGRA